MCTVAKVPGLEKQSPTGIEGVGHGWPLVSDFNEENGSIHPIKTKSIITQ